MALHLVASPPEVLTTYRASLLDFEGPRDPEVLLYHLPVYTLSLADLARGATTGDAARSGCRFYARWTDGSVTSCEMTEPTLYSQAEFRNFAQGVLPLTAFERIAEAQGLAQVQTQDYTLQFLSIPGIHFEGLYLVNSGDAGDLLLPVLSFETIFAIDAVLDAAAFLAPAAALAAARMAMSSDSLLSS
jgi:hypothetical protein